MTLRSPSRRFLVVCCVAAILGAGSGAAFTAANFSDPERGTVSIGAANDFTIDIGNATVVPDHIEADSQGVITVNVTVPNRSAVAESRFSISPPGADASVDAIRANCTLRNGSWACRMKFHRQPVVELFGTGNHTAVLHGWWTDNRDFVATDRLRIVDHGVDADAANRTRGNTSGNGTNDAAGSDGSTSAGGNADDNASPNADDQSSNADDGDSNAGDPSDEADDSASEGDSSTSNSGTGGGGGSSNTTAARSVQFVHP